MDPVSLLATAATTFLIPQLTKIGEEVMDDFGKHAWDLIMEIFTDKPASVSTAEEFSSKPDDPDNQAAFEAQLRKALKENSEFAKQLEGLLEKAEKAGITNRDGVVATQGSVVVNVDGNVNAPFIVGDENKITQTTNQIRDEPAHRKNKKSI